MNNFWQIIFAGLLSIWLPAVVYAVVAAVMILISGHTYVDKRLRENAEREDRTVLNMRLGGYDRNAVARHWRAFDVRARQSERRFLQLDLVFPLFYGASLAIALRQAWMASGRPFSAVVPVAIVAITMITDWTENLIQLAQLRLYDEHGADGLQDVPIRIASAATSVKLLFFTGTVLLTMILAASAVV